MTRAVWLQSFTSLATFALAAWLYSSFRTMRETIGLDAVTVLSALLATAVFVSVPVAAVRAMAGFWGAALGRSPVSVRRVLLPPVTIALVVASLTAETWILRDERLFRTQVTANPDAPHSRPRAWPNELSALIYSPELGMWATD